MPVRLRNAGATHFRVEFDRNLRGPEQANALRVVLPGGLLQQGPIVDGRNKPGGGWLLIDVEAHELPLEPSAYLNGWKWQ